MSWHKEQYVEAWGKVVAHVQAHPLPYLLVAILVAGIFLGRCSAN